MEKHWKPGEDEQRFMEPWTMRMDFLTLIFPGKAYLVHLVFDAGSGTPPWYEPYFSGEDRFRGWKVDLVTPLRRTGRGFDFTDEVLDIIVRPDRSWYWKDEDQMARYLVTGVYTEAEVEHLRPGRL
ncbi:DUF402 domain-containing protein [Candidatus Acetothermia bacterium]|nr:DUF402 domain-containing protein [Candidatus Acetothermia bacterium]